MLGRHLSAVQEAEQIVAEHQSVNISNGVTVPTWLFAGGIGLAVGIIASDALLTSTEVGKRRLAEMVAERLGRR